MICGLNASRVERKSRMPKRSSLILAAIVAAMGLSGCDNAVPSSSPSSSEESSQSGSTSQESESSSEQSSESSSSESSSNESSSESSSSEEPVIPTGITLSFQESTLVVEGGKHILEVGKTYHLLASLTPEDADPSYVEYEVESGREGNISIDGDGTVHALSVWSAIKLTASIKGSDVKAEISVGVYSPSDIAALKLPALEENTREKEIESSISYSYKRETYDGETLDGTEVMDATVYADEIVETRDNDSTSTYNTYERHRRIIDNQLVDIQFDLDSKQPSEVEYKTIGEDISEQEAKEALSLIYYSGNYGLSGILFNDFLGNGELGSSEALAKRVYEDDGSTLRISAMWEEGTYFSSYYYNDLTISYSEDLSIDKIVYTVRSYDDDPFDENGNLTEGATPSDKDVYTIEVTYGSREQIENPLDLSPYYFTDFEISLEEETFNPGYNYKVKVSSTLPSTGSSIVDPIRISKVEDKVGEDVLTIGEDGLTFEANSVGTATITVSSKNVSKTIDVTVSEIAVESITINYDGLTSLFPGESSDTFYAEVGPYDVSDRTYTLSIIEGAEYGVLEKDSLFDGYYTLKVNEDAVPGEKIVVEAKSNGLGADGLPLTDTIEFTVASNLSDEQLTATLIANDWSYDDYGDVYTASFSEDGTGTFINLYDGEPWFTITFKWTLSDGEITLSDIVTDVDTYELNSISIDPAGAYVEVSC